MFERLLVPTDGSAVSDRAVDQAITLARLFDGEVHGLHVLEVGELPPGVEDESAGHFERIGERALADLEEHVSGAGIPVTTAMVEAGESTHRAIVDYATEHDVDLVVMGTHGRSGLDRYVIGSVAERTLRESPIPVLTVHEDTAVTEGFDAVLVPTDGSDESTAAVDPAVAVANATDATFHAIYVVNTSLGLDADFVGTLDALEEAAQRALDGVVDRARSAGVDAVESSVGHGIPHLVILDYVDDHDVDLVVMGTHGRTGLKRHLLGSVTERVVRLSEAPVLTVPLTGGSSGTAP